MKTKLHYLIMTLLFGFGMNAQIVKLTGNGVGGWNQAGMVELTSTDGVNYSKTGLEILGTGGGSSEIKFQPDAAGGQWATVEGVATGTADLGWPSGIATATGAMNIGAVPGFWNVTYNIVTKAYAFTPGVNPNPTIKVTGTAVGATDISLSTLDGTAYSKESVTFGTGTAKFIQDASTNQWSSTAFPDGIGTQAGALIPVPAGTYYVYFYRNSGEYSFQPTVVSIIGGFNNWGGDVDMTSTDGVTFTLTNQVFASDTALKFRDNHNWNFNYGSTTNPSGFPSGTGTMTAATDIAVPAGTYTITFNRSTLAYNFTLTSVPNPVVKITGTALAADVTMSTTDGVVYSKGAVDFTAGNAKFVEDLTTNQWSSAAWPSGTGTQTGALIPVVADTYNVNFNKTTGAYSFDHLMFSIIGGFNGWNGDVDMTTTDGITYSALNQVFTADTELKFRMNHAWAVAYGSVGPTAASYPSGAATATGANNIAIPAGSYDITFVRTGANGASYNFQSLGVNAFSTSNFSVYPNPTTNVWNFVSANGTAIDAIQIMDVLGKVVMNTKGTSVNASQLTNGVYFAKITSNNAVQTVKVVKN